MTNYTPKKDSCKPSTKILRKLATKKQQNLSIINTLRACDSKNTQYTRMKRTSDNIEQCATYVVIDNYANEAKITRANFCRERLCNVCAWRKQSKFVATTYPALELLERSGYKMIFLTLTVRNVPADQLSATIDTMQLAFTKLMRSKLMAVVQGYIKSLEVTYKHSDNTVHPHIHILAILPIDYYVSDDYITHDNLVIQWQKSLKCDYRPNVDIRPVKQHANKKPYIETLKYTLKPQLLPTDVLFSYYAALSGRRLITFGGILKRLRADNDDLCDIPDKLPDVPVTRLCMRFNCNTGFYDCECSL